jgi:hypothetical protein
LTFWTSHTPFSPELKTGAPVQYTPFLSDPAFPQNQFKLGDPALISTPAAPNVCDTSTHLNRVGIKEDWKFP